MTAHSHASPSAPPTPLAPSAPAPASSPIPFSATLRGLWFLTWKSRLTWRQWPALAGTILSAALLAFLVLRKSEGPALDYFYWLSAAYILLGIPLYCLAVFGGLIRDELQSNTLSFLITRPMSRARFILTRFLCQLAWVQLLGLAAGLALLATGAVCGVSGVPRFAALFLGTQAIAFLVFGALATFLGLLHRRYLVLGTIYGLVVEVGIGQIPTNINTLAMTRHLRTLLGHNSDLARIYEWSTEPTGVALLVLLFTALIFLALSAILFTWREYLGSEEMLK
jgi:ABC-type transport system involved in multi-copper enzyme maturation permease subunit